MEHLDLDDGPGDAPFAEEYLRAASSLMVEWASAEDDNAFADL
jgi:hypothetical protein